MERLVTQESAMSHCQPKIRWTEIQRSRIKISFLCWEYSLILLAKKWLEGHTESKWDSRIGSHDCVSVTQVKSISFHKKLRLRICYSKHLSSSSYSHSISFCAVKKEHIHEEKWHSFSFSRKQKKSQLLMQQKFFFFRHKKAQERYWTKKFQLRKSNVNRALDDRQTFLVSNITFLDRRFFLVLFSVSSSVCFYTASQLTSFSFQIIIIIFFVRSLKKLSHSNAASFSFIFFSSSAKNWSRFQSAFQQNGCHPVWWRALFEIQLELHNN